MNDNFNDINQELATYIKNAIHDITTLNSGIYEKLFFCDRPILQKYSFNFNFDLDYNPKLDTLEKNYDDIEKDIKFFLDNIIAKIIEINLNINYRQTTRLGGSIKVNDIIIENHFLIDDYILKDTEIGLADLENYIDDIKVFISKSPKNYRYTISLEIPIYDVKDLFL